MDENQQCLIIEMENPSIRDYVSEGFYKTLGAVGAIGFLTVGGLIGAALVGALLNDEEDE